MLLNKGFKTLAEAKEFSKTKEDSKISWIDQPELKPHSHNKLDILYAMTYGYDEKKYPFCVTYQSS